MPGPEAYSYASPLAGYEHLPPLPTDLSPSDGKSLVNPPTGVLSGAYQRFEAPISNGPKAGFDVHVYFFQDNPAQKQYATELWERIRREFPELRIYRIFAKPIGPHPIGMFEVNLFTPAQFGAFVAWLVIHRGPLSALVHPNTDDEERDHSQRATWLGKEVVLDMAIFKGMSKTLEGGKEGGREGE